MPKREESESAPLLQQSGGSQGGKAVISLVACSASPQPSPAAAAGQAQAAAAQLPAAAPGVPCGVTACLLLADMLGVGALSLPSVFARLGWLVSCIFLAVFSLGCGYLGVLFSKLGVAVPSANAFDEIGQAAMGKLGARLTYVVVYTTIFVDPIVLQLTCVLALQRIVTGLSRVWAGVIVALIMVPLAQIQSIHDIGFLGIAATGCMVAAVGIAVIKMLAMPGNKLEQTSLLPPPGTGVQTAVVALLNLMFAFGGQVNWMRYESAMKSRSEFKYAVEVADLCMTTLYVALAVIGYIKLGVSFDHTKPVTSVLPQDAWVVLMNLALLVRCIIAYIININVWIDMVIRAGKPWVGRLEGLHPRHGQKFMWLIVSCAGIAFSFVVAWAVPSFSTILALIASVGDVAAPFTLPALFGLALLKDIQDWEKWLLRAIVPVSALFAAIGFVVSLLEMFTL